jgi:hypothetical protein
MTMPKRKRTQPPTTKQGNWHKNRTGDLARRIEVYSAAFKIALAQIPADQKRSRPDISLRVHASIRRQLKAGAADAHTIAFAALKDVLAPDTP